MASISYNLKWKRQEDHFKKVLTRYYKNQLRCDVTLTSEGQFFQAHQLALSACSTYFEAMFSQVPVNSHPIIFLTGVSASEISLILNYIYEGEVNVPKNLMRSFLHTCELLQIQSFVFDEESEEEIIDSNSSNDNYCSIQTNSEFNKDTNITTINENNPEQVQERNVFNSPPCTPNSFVFSLNGVTDLNKDLCHSSDSVEEVENNIDLVEISDDEGQEPLNEQFEENVSTKVDISENDFCDEDFYLRLSGSSRSTNQSDISNDSEIIHLDRGGPNSIKRLKMEAKKKGKLMKVILNRHALSTVQEIADKMKVNKL